MSSILLQFSSNPNQTPEPPIQGLQDCLKITARGFEEVWKETSSLSSVQGHRPSIRKVCPYFDTLLHINLYELCLPSPQSHSHAACLKG